MCQLLSQARNILDNLIFTYSFLAGFSYYFILQIGNLKPREV